MQPARAIMTPDDKMVHVRICRGSGVPVTKSRKKEGRREGKKEGKILGTIETMRDDGKDDQAIIARLIKNMA